MLMKHLDISEQVIKDPLNLTDAILIVSLIEMIDGLAQEENRHCEIMRWESDGNFHIRVSGVQLGDEGYTISKFQDFAMWVHDEMYISLSGDLELMTYERNEYLEILGKIQCQLIPGMLTKREAVDRIQEIQRVIGTHGSKIALEEVMAKIEEGAIGELKNDILQRDNKNKAGK